MDLTRWKLSVPIMLLGSLLGAAVGAGAAAGTKGAELTAATETNRAQDAKNAEQDKEIRGQSDRLIRVETNTDNLVKALDRLEKHFGTKR